MGWYGHRWSDQKLWGQDDGCMGLMMPKRRNFGVGKGNTTRGLGIMSQTIDDPEELQRERGWGFQWQRLSEPVGWNYTTCQLGLMTNSRKSEEPKTEM